MTTVAAFTTYCGSGAGDSGFYVPDTTSAPKRAGRVKRWLAARKSRIAGEAFERRIAYGVAIDAAETVEEIEAILMEAKAFRTEAERKVVAARYLAQARADRAKKEAKRGPKREPTWYLTEERDA